MINKVIIIGNLGIPTTKQCVRCGRLIERSAKHTDKQWQKKRYCSPRCSSLRRDLTQDVLICEAYMEGESCYDIGKKFGFSGKHIQRILKENGVTINQYKIKYGGISITDNGYLRFNNTSSNGVNAGRRLHDIIAEMKIGRPLKKYEVVHHIDGNKLNNDPANLEVMTRAQHTALHKRRNEQC